MISVLILTLNEELNLGKCLESIPKFIDDIVVLDSFSNDKTLSIAQSDARVRVYQKTFVSYSEQVQHALDHIDFKYSRLFRIDADEELCPTPNLKLELQKVYDQSPDAVFTIYRSISFLGKVLRYGGCGNNKIARIVSVETAAVSSVPIDEHFISPSGEIINLNIFLTDRCNKGLNFWLHKHIRYSDLERLRYNMLEVESSTKRSLYYRIPNIFRPTVYFLYRYIFQLGFLDGRPGFYYLVLQSFWFRTLVEIKLDEQRSKNN